MLALSCLYLIAVLAIVVAQIDDITNLVEVDHSVNGGDFVPRSKYALKLKDGKYEISIVEAEKNSIGGENLDGFKKALSDNGLYRIRVKTSQGGKSSIAAIPACELQRSGFKEDLVLHLDDDKQLIGLAYSSPQMAISRPCDGTKIKGQISLQTRVKVAEAVAAQAVPLQATGPKPPNMQKINFDTETDAEEASKPKTSWVRRYWYIIIPTLFYLFTSLTAPDEPAGKGGAKPAGGAK